MSKATRIIAGIVAIVAAVIVLSVPGSAAAFSAGILITVQLVAGIAMVVSYIKCKNRNLGISIGIGTLILGILLALLAIIAVFSPAIKGMLAIMVTIIFVINLMMKGIADIVLGAQKLVAFPVVNIIIGILMILIAFEGIASIFMAAIAMDTFMGMGLLFFGVALLCSSEDVYFIG